MCIIIFFLKNSVLGSLFDNREFEKFVRYCEIFYKASTNLRKISKLWKSQFLYKKKKMFVGNI